MLLEHNPVGWLACKQQKLTSHRLEDREVQGQDAERVGIWSGQASWVGNGTFSLYAYTGRGKGVL